VLRPGLSSFSAKEGRMSCSGLPCRPQLCMHTSKWAGGALNSVEGRYLQTVNYTKARFNNKPLGRTWLDKTQKNIGLLIAVLNWWVTICNNLSVLIKLPYYVLYTCYIMCVKLYYWYHSCDRMLQIISLRAPGAYFWPSLSHIIVWMWCWQTVQPSSGRLRSC
jgi:hypothetical protein